MSFANLYYKRTAATPKACYICYKPTPTVLATLNTTDFLYTCVMHLSDPGFAALVEGGEKKQELSPEEIAKVKEEWEEQQRKKKEKKEKERERDDSKSDSKESETKSSKSTFKSPESSTSSLPTPPAQPTHERYTLHRDIFALRQAEHRRVRQATQAKELAPRLPGAPRGNIA